MEYCSIRFLTIASSGDAVLSERIDTMHRADGSVVADCPIMGVIVVQDGRIVRYTDYMDLSDLRPR